MVHDPSAYGRSFADVYDEWYAESPADQIVAFVASRVPAGARLLEVGIGTGRVALPLAAAGFAVSGIDASADMVARLREKVGGAAIDVTIADAADAETFPVGPHDVVLAAFNLVFNLADRADQARFLANVARTLRPGGLLIVEAFVPAPMGEPARELVTRSVTDSTVVLIATETDPARSAVHGAHIELTDGSVRLRPWRLCVATPSQLDELAATAGLALVERHASWAASGYVAGDDAHHVSVYRTDAGDG